MSGFSFEANRTETIPKNEILNVKDVAKLLGVCEKTVYAACKRGELPSRRIGKRYLFSRTVLLEWLRGQGR